eukprot:GHVO01047646.1.p1 GENE.GHVO01047646.1~~GHVO01047646.1.p1  ORF type:complete len:426 (+),score=89.15 GHVO01047646.1:79-1278(+)
MPTPTATIPAPESDEDEEMEIEEESEVRPSKKIEFSTNVMTKGRADQFESKLQVESMMQKVHDVDEIEDAPVEDSKTGASEDNLKNRGLARAFASELRTVIERSDIVIQVLDARDPSGSRSSQLERKIKLGGKKKMVFVLNKVDLVPSHAVEKWTKFLSQIAPVIPFKAALGCATRAHYSTNSVLTASEGQLQSSSQVLGSSELLQLLKNYCRTSSSTKHKIRQTVGIVGYPNVGKSSIINALKRSSTQTKVGGVPGVTRKLQYIPLDRDLTLIDSPGVVMHGTSDDIQNILRNAVTISKLRDPAAVVDELVKRCPSDVLIRFFCVPRFNDSVEFLGHVARIRGKLARGGRPDLMAAARIVLSEWTSGNIRYYTLPPTDSHADADAVMPLCVDDIVMNS